MCENLHRWKWSRQPGCVICWPRGDVLHSITFLRRFFLSFFPTNKKQKRANRTYYVKRRQKVKKLYKLIVIEIFSPSPDFIFVCLCRQRWPIEHNKRCNSSVHNYAWITPNLEKKLELDKDRKQDETQCSANYLTFLYFYSVRNWHSKPYVSSKKHR